MQYIGSTQHQISRFRFPMQHISSHIEFISHKKAPTRETLEILLQPEKIRGARSLAESPKTPYAMHVNITRTSWDSLKSSTQKFTDGMRISDLVSCSSCLVQGVQLRCLVSVQSGLFCFYTEVLEQNTSGSLSPDQQSQLPHIEHPIYSSAYPLWAAPPARDSNVINT